MTTKIFGPIELTDDFAADEGVISLAAPGPRPNILLNGGMNFDQPNEGATVASGKCLDCWNFAVNSDATGITIQRVADAPSGLTHSAKITIGTGSATVDAGDYIIFQQAIERNHLGDLGFGAAGAKKVCLSVWLKSSITGTFGITLENGADNRVWKSMCQITSANTWTRFSFVINGDTAGTWDLFGVGVGGYVNVWAEAGSGWYGVAGTWTDGWVTSAQTNLSLTTAATLQITGVKLEVSNTPTPFVKRPYQEELLELRRYYRKTFAQGTAPAQNAGLVGALSGRAASTTAGSFSINVQLEPPMRIAPTVVTYNPSAANANWRSVTGSSDVVVQVDVSSSKGDSNVEIGTQTTALTVGHDLCIHATFDARL